MWEVSSINILNNIVLSVSGEASDTPGLISSPVAQTDCQKARSLATDQHHLVRGPCIHGFRVYGCVLYYWHAPVRKTKMCDFLGRKTLIQLCSGDSWLTGEPPGGYRAWKSLWLIPIIMTMMIRLTIAISDTRGWRSPKLNIFWTRQTIREYRAEHPRSGMDSLFVQQSFLGELR